MTKNSDRLKKLLIESLSGDKDSYREFFKEITPLVESIAQKAFHKEDVPDLVQEIFLSIHKSLPSFDPKRPVVPWVCAIANRRVIDYIRKISSRNNNEVLTEDGDVTIYPSQTKITIGGKIPPILEILPSDTKKAIMLTKYEGHSTEEAAKIMGIKSNALRTRISRGIKLIKKKFEEGHFDE